MKPSIEKQSYIRFLLAIPFLFIGKLLVNIGVEIGGKAMKDLQERMNKRVGIK